MVTIQQHKAHRNNVHYNKELTEDETKSLLDSTWKTNRSMGYPWENCQAMIEVNTVVTSLTTVFNL